MTRKFDSALGGLSLDEFIILYLLQNTPDMRMKRIDLVQLSGFTLAGLTRLCLPLEKLGLISREESKKDARMSYVILAVGGQRKLEGVIEKAETFVSGLIPGIQGSEVENLILSLQKVEKHI
ncbi:MarR family transcriptional regulator [Candidatus Gracilibacteria bacterium]|nr:MarR family transcriptional regulator [Candidatus Gracilibacteria bacterium]